jgi:hypothetical protein
MPLPNAVHEDAGCQRVSGPGDPIRQFKATTARTSRNNFATEHLKISARDFVAEPMWLATQLQTTILGRTFGDSIRDRIRELSRDNLPAFR